ncbi:MAG: hypothetical protein AAB851_00095 [Patescibacteria group bacterium]
MENLEEKIFKSPEKEATEKEILEKEAPEKKTEKETTRREFLVKTGKFLGGLAVLSYMGEELFSGVKELVESRKPARETEKETDEKKIKGRELFTQERLMEEIDEIKRTNPENWQEIAKERISGGIDKFVKLWTGGEIKNEKLKPFAEPETMIKGSILGLGAGIFMEITSNKKYEEESNKLADETEMCQLMETITKSPSQEIINWYGVGGAFLAEGGRLAKELITKRPPGFYKEHWFTAGEIAEKTAFELIFNERPFIAEFEAAKNQTNTTNIVSEMLKEEVVKNFNDFIFSETMMEEAGIASYLE